MVNNLQMLKCRWICFIYIDDIVIVFDKTDLRVQKKFGDT